MRVDGNWWKLNAFVFWSCSWGVGCAVLSLLLVGSSLEDVNPYPWGYWGMVDHWVYQIHPLTIFIVVFSALSLGKTAMRSWLSSRPITPQGMLEFSVNSLTIHFRRHFLLELCQGTWLGWNHGLLSMGFGYMPQHATTPSQDPKVYFLVTSYSRILDPVISCDFYPQLPRFYLCCPFQLELSTIFGVPSV